MKAILSNDIKEILKNEALKILSDIENNELLNFLKESSIYLIEHCEFNKELRFNDIGVGSRNFLILINDKSIVFRDDLTDYEEIFQDKGNLNLEECKLRYNKLLENISDNKAELRTSGEGNYPYLWYDLIFKINDFTIERLNKCEKIWSEYNKELDKFS